jgi:DNA-binding NarL/FixJ family response regulator
MTTITILILQANPYAAEGIKAVLEDDGLDTTCVTAHNVSRAWSATFLCTFDCAIVDHHAFPDAVSLFSGCAPVICLPSRDTPAILNDALSEGATAYVRATEPPLSLTEAIRGNNPLTQERWRQLLADIDAERHANLTSYDLTQRETEALLMMADGYSNPTIAREMSITVGGLRGHQRAIYDKLRVRNRHEAILLMVKLGIV